MAEKETGESELGRSKHSATPKEHLAHLLNIGWNTKSPLIQKYAIENGLTRDLEDLARELNNK